MQLKVRAVITCISWTVIHQQWKRAVRTFVHCEDEPSVTLDMVTERLMTGAELLSGAMVHGVDRRARIDTV